MYEAAVQSLTQACENTNFVDRKDFMYLHGRVARFIFPLRYFKEFTSPLRRPFLSNQVLEIVRRLPAQHRLYKNLYISMLYHRFPRAISVPIVRANSLPDWALDIRRELALRSLFLRLLDFGQIEQGVLGQLLNRAAFERLRDNFFNAEAQPLARYDSWTRLLKWKMERAISWSRRVTSTVHRLYHAADPRPPSSFEILRRIALVNLLQENLDDLARPSAPSGVPANR
jgi:hypothetical protein